MESGANAPGFGETGNTSDDIHQRYLDTQADPAKLAREYQEEGLEYVTENMGISILEGVLVDEPAGIESDEVRWIREMKLKHKELGWWSRPSILYICLVLLTIAITDALILPSVTVLSMQRICESLASENNSWTEDNSPICDAARVQQIVSNLASISLILNGIVGTLMAGKLGELSDRVGRVPIFVYTGVLRTLSALVLYYVFFSKGPFSYKLYILGQCLPSFSGSVIGLIANGNSYLADIVEPSMRSIGISFVMSTIYGAAGIGPFLSSILINASNGNNAAPLSAALVFSISFTLICTFFMAESRHDEAKKLSRNKFMRRRESMESIISQQSESSATSRRSVAFMTKYTMWHLFDVFSPIKRLWLKPTATGSLVPRYMVLLLISTDVLFVICSAGILPPLVLAFTYTLKWDSKKLGYFVSTIGIGRAVVLLIVAPLALHSLKKRFKVLENSLDKTDLVILRVSILAILISIILLLLLNGEKSVYSFAIFQVMGAMFSPTVQASIIKYGSKKHTGEYFGAIALVRSLTLLISPPIFLSIYAKTVSFQPFFFLYLPLIFAFIANLFSACLKIVTDPVLLRRESEASLLLPSSISKPTMPPKPINPPCSRRDSAARSLRGPMSSGQR